MEFWGYRRPDGSVGIRNHVLVMPTVVCANQVARGIAQAVKGSIWVEHQHGCAQLGADAAQTEQVFIGHGTHPNVYGVIVVGLGCESIRAQEVAQAIKEQCPYKPVHCVIIQESGGSYQAIAAGAALGQKMMIEASQEVREAIPVSNLILATECGGSDACSGLSANPALGVASDTLIDAGGTSVIAETPEMIGAEHLLAARAVSPAVSERCFATVKAFEDAAKRSGVDMRGGNPTPGNIEGGISTIEEKSLGCVHKAGSRPLVDVLPYGGKVTKKGLNFMDTPGNDIEQLTGMAAGGCHICVFTTGRGTPTASPIMPTIKVSTNSGLYARMPDNMDLNAGNIIEGTETIDEVGQRIFAEIIAVANGKLTKAEILGHNDFGIQRIGPTF